MRRFSSVKRQDFYVCAFYGILHTALAALVIVHYFGRFAKASGVGFYSLFTRNFHVSGYDPYTLVELSNGQVCFDASRHPLLFPLLWPLQQLNALLIHLTGVNCAVFIMAAVNVAAAVAAALFLFRTLRYCLRMPLVDSHLLTLFCFSSAHVMLCAMVPDHFALSLFLLVYTMYRAAWILSRRQRMGWVEAFCLFFLTAGVTLTNGVKTAIALFFIRQPRGASWLSSHLVHSLGYCCKIVVPASLALFLIFFAQDRIVLSSQREKAHRIEQALEQKQPKKMAQLRRQEAFRKQQNGQALTDTDGMLRFSDVTTPRLPSLWHNAFGETFILHRQHLLEDVQRKRPVFVPYDSLLSYSVEVVIIVFFLFGWAVGVRHPLMAMLTLWLSFDALVHIGFGFALNEVYIMAAHWLFVVPVAASFFLRRHRLARLFYAIVPFLLLHNTALLIEYFLS